ncbi:class II aldolase/adducin N-terminal [Ilyonectria robusta]|uniref:class II aldolase/adducin N-terminal n=1 Tax=Ilyonectria robusta TaxID=1079257 RepID=UPI001E8E5E95|nr:class II aldolase/adducin N-terminal [Ilyonectria robusta]KAH6995495.1 class II aldolase/adducin N-terminal [Ilyonectria sp. MPI-CAGE-AT-0026]KAH8736622.1 class II aldolase/adducin N-terminal [Ilyonectria robusta]
MSSSATITETQPQKELANVSLVAEAEPECQLANLSHGPNPLTGIPTFVSFQAHREHIILHMAAVFRNWARVGYIEGISGHISVRDPEFPGCIWMNPIGKHFALMNASDMVCLEIATGRIVGGNKVRPVNKPGFFIHSEMHKARHDVHAICHAHTMAGRAWTVFGKPLDMITQDVCDLYDSIAVMNEYGGIVAADEEGKQIARALGPRNKAALLLNHGLITVGNTVDEAAFLLGLVERSCEIQLKVEAACAGNPELKKTLIPDELCKFNFQMAGEKNWLYVEAQPDIEYEIEMAGGVIKTGLENMRVDSL